MIETATGQIRAESLGFTLPHEHVFVNLMPEYRGEGLLHDPELMVQELNAYRAAGGVSLIETTSGGLGRDPEGLRQASPTSTACGSPRS